MRAILILWMIPVVLFWGWYGLSVNNLHFGVYFLERDFHDMVFNIYGKILQMPAEEVPVALAWLFGVDTLIVFGFAALRWYKKWLPQTISFLRSFFGFPPSNEVLEERVEIALENHQAASALPIGPVQPAE